MAGPMVCSTPAPSPDTASSAPAAHQASAARATRPVVAPVARVPSTKERITQRWRTRPTIAEPTTEAPFATDTRTPMVEAGCRAASSATGT